MLRWLFGCKGAQESASGHEGYRWVQRTRVAASLPPANEVWGKVMFYTCVSFCSRGEGVSIPACITGHMTEGVSVPGGSLSGGVSVQRGLWEGEGFVQGEVSVRGGGSVRETPDRDSSLYGTHPNGMHSGFSIVLQNQHLLWRFQANWLRINQDIWDDVQF